jgi:hypothetical protein
LIFSEQVPHIVAMFIRKTTRKYKDKTYTNHLLVESVHTPKGPRQKVICSLGDLSPRPAGEWLKFRPPDIAPGFPGVSHVSGGGLRQKL